MLHLKCVVNVWPIVFLCHLAVILTQPVEETAVANIATKTQTREKLSDDLKINVDANKHYHNDNNTESDVKISANNSDLEMAGSNNKAPFVHFPPSLKPRGFHLPRNRGGQSTRQQDVTQTSAQSFYNQFFPNLPNLEQHARSYFPLSEEPLISKFLSHHAKEFQPKHGAISAYDASVLGSGDFGILKGGTFYSGEEPSYIHEEGSDIYYGDASNAHGIASTEGFVQKYTYPEEQFAQFRDFADLSTPADSAFSQYVVVYANKNSSSPTALTNSKPKNIFEQLQEIDREKALEEKKVKKNHTLSSSITKLKLVKTKLMEKKWVQRQPVKTVDDDPLIALS